MAAFYEIDTNLKSILLSMIFLLNLCQYGYLILLFHYGEKRRGYGNILPALVVFLALTFLVRSLHSRDGCLGQVPVVVILLIWIVLSVYTAVGAARQVRRGHQMLTVQSVKESADKLPGGLAYFAENGILVLCNTRMQEIFHQITGHDLQMMWEMENVLKEGTVLHLSDGRVWKVERSEVHISKRQHYTQFIASDLTELYQIREKIDRDNEKMQELIQKVQNITENDADITRQEEILTAKMRVHNKMGNCMLAARQYLMADQPHQKEEKAQLIRLWKENLEELKNEVGACDTPDAYEMVVQIAKHIGLEVTLHGTMPENQKTAYLLVVALRECVTNALNHAKAKHLDMTVSKAGTKIIASYTNDGLIPEGEIREGGGLSSLRTKIESVGGTMEVSSLPIFLLTITIPVSVEEGLTLEDI